MKMYAWIISCYKRRIRCRKKNPLRYEEGVDSVREGPLGKKRPTKSNRATAHLHIADPSTKGHPLTPLQSTPIQVALKVELVVGAEEGVDVWEELGQTHNIVNFDHRQEPRHTPGGSLEFSTIVAFYNIYSSVLVSI